MGGFLCEERTIHRPATASEGVTTTVGAWVPEAYELDNYDES